MRESLRQVHGLPDLHRVLAQWGHDRLWEPLAAEAGGGAGGGVVLGQVGDFWWIGIETSAPERDARRLAAHYARRGRFLGVLALSPTQRILAIAAGFQNGPVRVVALDHPSESDLESLTRCGGGGGSPLEVVRRIADALALDEVGVRFFRSFRQALARMRDELPERVPLPVRHELALLQLTRVLFLYFVQARGWLAGGKTDFLADLVDRALSAGRSLDRDLFRPLFFGTLNLPPDRRRGAALHFGPLPFLNGGLFQRHPLEARWRVEFPNTAWRPVFDEVFERYHFTATPAPAGIDPLMLGRVFEGVMTPEERHTSGTYYTAPALVDVLVRETVTVWLAGRLGIGAGAAERELSDPSPAGARALRGVTILDPAVGSGAFLVAALRLLAAVPLDRSPLAERRRRILGRSLYGVDENASAVRITELRLWLELLTPAADRAASRLLPLPNLDGTIRQGDSLIEPAAIDLRGVGAAELAALRDARQILPDAHGPAKGAAVRGLRRAERRVALAALDEAMARVTGAIRDLTSAGDSPGLFGPQGLTPAQRAALAAHRAERARLRRLLRKVREDDQVPWFQYGIHFGDVFAGRGGVDVILGNPPWVRAEVLPRAVREHLGARYSWWRATAGPRGFRHQPDLSIAFVQRAVELLRPGGALGLVLPAKVATATYATRAREGLARTTTLHVAADLTGDPRAVFDATTYPLALVSTREAPPDGHAVATTLGSAGPTVAQAALQRPGPWILRDVPAREIRDRLAAEFPAIGDRFHCRLGVKTGLNRFFVDPPASVEPELVRGAIRGRDLRPFTFRSRHRLFWPYDADGELFRRLPPGAWAYVRAHAASLAARVDCHGEAYWQLFRTDVVQGDANVLWRDLARGLEAAVLDAPGRAYVPLNTCYAIATTHRYARALAGWLNTTWMRALALLSADRAASGYWRFNARVVAALPLPDAVLTSSQLHEAAATRPHCQVTLDETAALLLHLSPRDRHVLAHRDGVPSDGRR